MKKRVIFLDRDGTIIDEPSDTKQVDSLERLSFIPGVIGALSRICKSTGYELVMVTNQDGLGTASFPEATFEPPQQKMLQTLAGEGVTFSSILIDRSFPQENLPTRKPGTALLTGYQTEEYDLANSFVVGDRASDLELAVNLGAKGIFFGAGSPENAAYVSQSWPEIAQYLCGTWRSALVTRTTRETSVKLSLALTGAGVVRAATGIGFFDHMLELLGAHAGFDLTIEATGDLHVDEHHLVEDVGITLGQAIKQALGDKRGVERYGFLLPMDESLAQVALDLSNRSRFVWSGEFRRERLGTFPTELIPHFFESLAQELRCALHISVRGENEHHKAEAVFKGVGRVLKQACTLGDPSQGVPSTKGIL